MSLHKSIAYSAYASEPGMRLVFRRHCSEYLIILLGHYNNTCKVPISVNSQHLLSPVSPESLNVNLQILQTPCACHYIQSTLSFVRSLYRGYLNLCKVTPYTVLHSVLRHLLRDVCRLPAFHFRLYTCTCRILNSSGRSMHISWIRLLRHLIKIIVQKRVWSLGLYTQTLFVSSSLKKFIKQLIGIYVCIKSRVCWCV